MTRVSHTHTQNTLMASDSGVYSGGQYDGIVTRAYVGSLT